MALPFRRRVFLVLIAMGTLPTAAALVALAVQVRSGGSPSGPRAALEALATSGREALAAVDTAALEAGAREAARAHAAMLSRSVTLARRAETLSRYTAGALAAMIFVIAGLLVAASVRLAGHFSRQLSRPIDELVSWTRMVERHEPLPASGWARGAPEFAALREALRGMADALEQARDQELEAERLRGFRELARRVAHEIRGPVTSIRLAVARLERRRGSDDALAAPLDVLADEAARLERLAQEFAELGRLPEGPAAEIDVSELLEHVARAGVADGVAIRIDAEPGLAVRGHYEPLRRAVLNLVRNAAEAAGGEVTVTAHGVRDGTATGVRVAVIDHGPGVPSEVRGRLFEPYVTTKPGGTGLGLALVRQTVEAHGGTVVHEPTPGGGATFVITLPRGGRA